MGSITEEIQSYIGSGAMTDEEYLEHYGMPRRSGRYPYGSGEDPYQHSGRDFLGRVDEMRKAGTTYVDENGKSYTGDTAIAKTLGLSTSQFRTEIALAKDEERLYKVNTAKRLRDKEGLSTSEIGRKMGVNESTVRSWFDTNSESRTKQAQETANFLKDQLKKYSAEKGMIDVGSGTERELNISKEKLNQALYLLEREGYAVYGGRVQQVTNPGQFTTQKVLCSPGTKHSDIYDLGRVHSVNEYISRDDGKTYEKKFHYPESLDSKRLAIRYKEDGGINQDGLVELRRGVPDLSLGESRYSQVRIMVDGKKYIKGMAVYSDNMPDGVDVIFNTNKSKSVSKLDVLKDIKDDPSNPFGSAIKDSEQGGQYWYDDPKTGKKKLGLINKRADEGDWSEWNDSLPSQFLSKQARPLAKKQLDLAKANKEEEFAEIKSLTNPTIKKHLLAKFADNCDSAAVNLKAAALPGQKYHVIIPVPSLKDTEVFAPNYADGTKLALIRYPHGGTFEIPILTVNNKNALAKKRIGIDAGDGIGINSKVAERLSGADFDGDTVMCIPTHNGKVKITSTHSLKGLEGFDPKMEYPERPGMKYMKDPKTGTDNTQKQMGVISNLISDMTLVGAKEDELARAVRHSMVVIDAGKHKLDYKKSEIDNNISELKKKYQKHIDADGNVTYGGASTIISRSKGQTSVYKRQGEGKVNLKGKEWYDPSRPEGVLVYKNADDLYRPDKTRDKNTGLVSVRTMSGQNITYDPANEAERKKYAPVKKIDEKTGAVMFVNADGTVYRSKARTQKSTSMAETDDATTLVSPARHPMEILYADYANSMKKMAREARLEMVSTGKIAYDKGAKDRYRAEVKSLEDKLSTAEKNKTKERSAQRLANVEVTKKREDNPKMKTSDIKKAGQQAISKYREEVGSVSRKKRNIEITDREWEAIQAGAISENKLKAILNNTDIDKLRERATPRTSKTISQAKAGQIKAMSATYTIAQIADKLGISPSTVSKYLKGGK